MNNPLKSIASQAAQELFGISFNFEYTFNEQEVVINKIGDFLYKAKLSETIYYDLQGPNSGKFTIKNGVILDSTGVKFDPKISFSSCGNNYELGNLQLTRNLNQIIENGEISYNFLVNEVQIQIVIKSKICKGTLLFRIIYVGNSNSSSMNYGPYSQAQNQRQNFGGNNFGFMPHAGFAMPHFY